MPARPSPRPGRTLTALAALCLACAAHADDSGTTKYRLKAEPHVGSAIPDVLASGSLPYDKRWAELTAQQQEQLKSNYESLGPDDEPPYPLYGMGALMRSFSKVAQAVQVTGPVSMAVEVGPDGKARSVSVFRSPDAESAKAFASVLMIQDYKPALCKGQPCIMQFPFRINLQRRLR